MEVAKPLHCYPLYECHSSLHQPPDAKFAGGYYKTYCIEHAFSLLWALMCFCRINKNSNTGSKYTHIAYFDVTNMTVKTVTLIYPPIMSIFFPSPLVIPQSGNLFVHFPVKFMVLNSLFKSFARC